MESEDLYNLLINFDSGSLRRLGLIDNNGIWSHPDSPNTFVLHEGRLSVYIKDTMISRLNTSTSNPVDLYHTFVETGIIEPAVHINYLREKGLSF